MLAISLKKHNRKIIVSTLDVQFRMIERKNGNEFHLMLKCQLTKKTHCTFFLLSFQPHTRLSQHHRNVACRKKSLNE